MDTEYKGNLGKAYAACIKPQSILTAPGETADIRTPYFIPLESIHDTRGLYYRTLDLYIELHGDSDNRPHPFLITGDSKSEIDGVDYHAARAPYIQRIRYIDNTLGADNRTKYINIMGHVFPVEVEQDKERETGVYITHKSNVCADYENIDETYHYPLDSDLVKKYFFEDSTSAAKEGSLEYRRAREAEERKDATERELIAKRLEMEQLKLDAQEAKNAEINLQYQINKEREAAKALHDEQLRKHQLEETRLKKEHEEAVRQHQLEEARLKKQHEEAMREQVAEETRIRKEHEDQLRRQQAEETRMKRDFETEQRKQQAEEAKLKREFEDKARAMKEAYDRELREHTKEMEAAKATRVQEEYELKRALEQMRTEREREKEAAETIRRDVLNKHEALKIEHDKALMEWQKEKAKLENEARISQNAAEEKASKMKNQRDAIGLIGTICGVAGTLFGLYMKFRRS
jgi:hypothetical protein